MRHFCDSREVVKRIFKRIKRLSGICVIRGENRWGFRATEDTETASAGTEEVWKNARWTSLTATIPLPSNPILPNFGKIRFRGVP